MVLSSNGSILALERLDQPGSWQVPQGGVNHGEDLREAALRELAEETGIGPLDLEVVDEHPEWLTYELPPASRTAKTGRGQTLRLFLMRLGSDESSINLDGGDAEPEFARWRWMSAPELLNACWEVKRPLYQLALDHWSASVRVSD